MNSFAENLSKDPIKSISPSGATKKETEGLTTCLGLHEGAASMTPPTCQKASMYSSQFLYKDGMAILTFFGNNFEMTSTSLFSIILSVISNFLFLSSMTVLNRVYVKSSMTSAVKLVIYFEDPCIDV